MSSPKIQYNPYEFTILYPYDNDPISNMEKGKMTLNVINFNDRKKNKPWKKYNYLHYKQRINTEMSICTLFTCIFVLLIYKIVFC